MPNSCYKIEAIDIGLSSINGHRNLHKTDLRQRFNICISQIIDKGFFLSTMFLKSPQTITLRLTKTIFKRISLHRKAKTMIYGIVYVSLKRLVLPLEKRSWYHTVKFSIRKKLHKTNFDGVLSNYVFC